MSEMIDKSAPGAQVRLPWRTTVGLAVKSIRKRFVRSMITMVSVVLAIAFLITIGCNHLVESGLRELNRAEINTMLRRNGVDLAAGGLSSKMLWLVSLSLLTCSVGIVNAMLMGVTGRFRESGTMKCLGATDGFIVRRFMVEALIQGTLGTAAGVIIGLVIGLAGSVLTYGGVAVTSLAPVSLLLLTGLAMLVGMTLCTLFAIYPAWVAAKMQPVDAMRVEQ